MGRIESKTRRAERHHSDHARPVSPHRGGIARVGFFAAGLASGLAIGAFAGGFLPSADAVPLQGEVAAHAPRAAADDVAAVAATGTVVGSEAEAGGFFAAWLELAESERLQEMARKVKGAGLDLMAESVIGRLEEDSLRSLIVSTTDFSSEDLAEIEDLPRFATDLARIAMDGTVREAEMPDENVRVIDFSEDITWDHRAAFTQSQFGADTERIYAVFESDGLGLSQTLAKWTRVSDGEIMLFKRHHIRPAADSSFVYLDAPAEGWRPGEYRVDFYSADPELRWIASGEHRVTL